MTQYANTPSIAVIDIGSPKLGNIGWCLINQHSGTEHTGTDLDALFGHIHQALKHGGLILGLEAPLCVPLRDNLMLATKARKGEGRRPWSAGAGAQVLAMNLPIMIYIFKHINALCPDATYHLNEDHFTAAPHHIMLFEALVSGQDKGTSHVADAQIMARSCLPYIKQNTLPPSILESEPGTSFFNLAAAALLRCQALSNIDTLASHSPIYKPNT